MDSMKFDLKSMSRKDLERLKGDVDKALEKVGEREMKTALEAAEKAAAAHGFSLKQLTGGKDTTAAPKRRGRKPGPKAAKAPVKKGAPKYANPADASQTWTGKGRQPDWFKAALASGTDPDKLAI
jgi:DNA-binding protein H-NS